MLFQSTLFFWRGFVCHTRCGFSCTPAHGTQKLWNDRKRESGHLLTYVYISLISFRLSVIIAIAIRSFYSACIVYSFIVHTHTHRRTGRAYWSATSQLASPVDIQWVISALCLSKLFRSVLNVSEPLVHTYTHSHTHTHTQNRHATALVLLH